MVDILKGSILGLKVDVEGKPFVFGVMLVGVVIAEEAWPPRPQRGGRIGGFLGPAGPQAMEVGVGSYQRI